MTIVPFSLSTLYIALNLRNYDKTIPTVNELNKINKSFATMSIFVENRFFQSDKTLSISLFFIIISSVILQLLNMELITTILNIVSVSFAVMMFILSTILHNNSFDKECNVTQLSFKRHYSSNETKQKVAENSKISRFANFDSSIGYTIVYLLGLILLFITHHKTPGTIVPYISIYFTIGLFFQLTTSFFLRLFNKNKSWPSIFTYLDEFIINNEDNNKLTFKIIGVIRITIIILACIYSSYSLTLRNKSVDNISILKFVSIIYLLFTLSIISWQVLVGDGCIVNRTIDKYKSDLEEKSDALDINLNIWSDRGKYFKNILYCSIDAQWGIYFHLIMIAMVSVFN